MKKLKKLKLVEFGVTTRDAMEEVVNAFKAPFPSLKHINGVDVFDWANGDKKAGQRIADQLERGSFDGEWPGTAYRQSRKMVDGREQHVLHVLVPYVGDREFCVAGHEDALIVSCDYTKRPSATAAKAVLELAERIKDSEKQGPLFLWDVRQFE